MILENSKISASRFRWENSVGCAMASDLGFRPGEQPHRQIYDDAVDRGLVVCGRKEKIFIYNRPMKDGEGEVYGWMFTSAEGDFSLVIFND